MCFCEMLLTVLRNRTVKSHDLLNFDSYGKLFVLLQYYRMFDRDPIQFVLMLKT